jgi:probable F420-dependent oxidoreductase
MAIDHAARHGREAQPGDGTMKHIGKLGVWYPIDRLDGTGIRQLLGTIEGLGYAILWYPEAFGYESMSIASFMLANTARLIIGSSIASIYARDAFTARRALHTLSDLYGDRFILGLGVSHVPMVEGVRGHAYDKPVPTMRRYLDGICKDQPGSDDWPIMLAALGPLMLKLAAERTAGAVPYNVTPEHTRAARAVLGPDKWLAVEQKVCLETNATTARALARQELERYMTLTNYRNNWLRMGFTEADLADGGSDRLIDAMVLWGDATTIKGGLHEHLKAGATHVCIQPIHAQGDIAARNRTLTMLADT